MIQKAGKEFRKSKNLALYNGTLIVPLSYIMMYVYGRIERTAFTIIFFIFFFVFLKKYLYIIYDENML